MGSAVRCAKTQDTPAPDRATRGVGRRQTPDAPTTYGYTGISAYRPDPDQTRRVVGTGQEGPILGQIFMGEKGRVDGKKIKIKLFEAIRAETVSLIRVWCTGPSGAPTKEHPNRYK